MVRLPDSGHRVDPAPETNTAYHLCHRGVTDNNTTQRGGGVFAIALSETVHLSLPDWEPTSPTTGTNGTRGVSTTLP